MCLTRHLGRQSGAHERCLYFRIAESSVSIPFSLVRSNAHPTLSRRRPANLSASTGGRGSELAVEQQVGGFLPCQLTLCFFGLLMPSAIDTSTSATFFSLLAVQPTRSRRSLPLQ